MFVIADVTSPKSTPLELEATVKQFKIPYIPIVSQTFGTGLQIPSRGGHAVLNPLLYCRCTTKVAMSSATLSS